MDKLIITKEEARKYSGIYGTPLITILPSRVVFSKAAAMKLALKVGDYFTIEVETFGKPRIYFKEDPKFIGFKIINLNKQTLMASSFGLLDALIYKKIISETRKIKFQLGHFKDGRYELIPLKQKNG